MDKEKLNADVSAAKLAYLGDAVYELIARARLIASPDGAHPSTHATEFVTAQAQSAALGRIEAMLTEEEADVYRRGRNCVHGNIPKSASAADYRRATGLEALMGYLWLAGRFDRALELFDAAFREI